MHQHSNVQRIGTTWASVHSRTPGDFQRLATPRNRRFIESLRPKCTSTPGGTRTPNLLVRSQALCPLSYEGQSRDSSTGPRGCQIGRGRVARAY